VPEEAGLGNLILDDCPARPDAETPTELSFRRPNSPHDDGPLQGGGQATALLF
jgi:hypothetical protein